MRRVVALIAILAGVGCDDGAAGPSTAGDAGQPTTTTEGGAACAPPVESVYSDTSAGHVAGEVTYTDLPPAGGTHNQCWGPWGVHETELPDERWVHNLEHGGVVYLYRCQDDCPSELATLTSFVTGRTQALLTPYAALPTRFAVVAWGVRMVSDCFDQQAFEDFYRAHVNRGPEKTASPPPAGCL